MPPNQEFIERLARLETAHRRLSRTVLALTLALAAVPFFLSLRPPKTIVANGLVIRDSNGQARVSLGAFEEDAFVSVYGPDKAELQLLTGKRGPVLTLVAPDGVVKGIFGGNSSDGYLRLQIGGERIDLGRGKEPPSSGAQ